MLQKIAMNPLHWVTFLTNITIQPSCQYRKNSMTITTGLLKYEVYSTDFNASICKKMSDEEMLCAKCLIKLDKPCSISVLSKLDKSFFNVVKVRQVFFQCCQSWTSLFSILSILNHVVYNYCLIYNNVLKQPK